jgi:hypothetical protein
MNFMVTPHQCLIENTRFTEEELSSAISVFNELVYLGPIAYVPDGYQLSNNFPLFLAPKPGKPGRHRCIADMKQGNQNAAIGKDPVHLYNPQDTPWMLQNASTCSLLYSENNILWGFSTQI